MYENKIRFALTYCLFGIIAELHWIAAKYNKTRSEFSYDEDKELNYLRKSGKHYEEAHKMYHYRSIMRDHVVSHI